MYNHFMSFAVAVCILISPKLAASSQQRQYARKLLKYFVVEGRNIYGAEFLVYNVHALIHLADYAQCHGSIQKCSAFPFENYLHKVKKLIRNGNNPLAQLVKRLSEIQHAHPNVKKSDGIVTKRPNNAYVMDDDTCCEAVQVVHEHEGSTELVMCRVYCRMRPYSRTPCDSRTVGVFQGSSRHTRMKFFPSEQLNRKAIMIEDSMEGAEGLRKVTFLTVLHDL